MSSMKKPFLRRIAIGAAVLFACVLILLIRMPVSALNWILPKDVSLVQASGSIWDGKASAVGWQGVVLQQNLNWQFDAKAVLAGTLAWQLRGEAQGAASQARAVLGWRGIALENVDVTVPLEGVFRAIPQVANWGLGGRAQLRSTRLSKQVGDSAELVLDPIFSQLVPALMPLTALRVQFYVIDGGTKWQVTPAGASAIAVTGQGELQWQGAAHGTINLKPEENVRQQLAPLLLQVPATSEGYQIKF
ncbi:type II secretion system protein N [Deefgea rivuli]|uniref:type II secretion system protein N n=1 Tax=Deefgea rivuli TaxID=400948 RepID=UPI00048716E1|nr:type II secretion system protein N [Deefgea rivuli]